MADWGFLDHERGCPPVALLHLDDFLLQLVERKLAANDVMHVVRIAAVDQHDTGRIIGRFLLAESNVPTQDNAVGGPAFDCGVVFQHFPLDDLADGGLRRLLVLGRKLHRSHILLDVPQHFGRLMGGMKEISLFTGMGAATAEIVGGCRLRDRGQAQNLKTGIAFEEIANEVIDMDPLHYDYDAGSPLVVGAGHQGRAVPFDDAFAGYVGWGVARLERIVDDREIAAASGQRSPNRGGVSTASERGLDFSIGVAFHSHPRKYRLIERILDDTPKIIGVSLCQVGRIRDANHALRGVMTEIPGRQRYRRDNRLEVARRDSDDQPLHLAGGDLRDLVGHRVDVPVRFEWRRWAKYAKHVVDKRPEIRGQDGPQDLLWRGVFGRGRTNGRVHDSSWFFFCSARFHSRWV